MDVAIGPEEAEVIVGFHVVGKIVKDLFEPLFRLIQSAERHANARQLEPR